MRHLNLIIESATDFNPAVDYFLNDSNFSCDQTVDEYRAICFPVTDQEDADALEPFLADEMQDLNIDNYHFEFI